MRLPVAVLACALLAACTVPEEKFARNPDGSFVFASQAYDLFPLRTDIAEAWRMQEMRRRLAHENLCPESYVVETRAESAVEEGYLYRYEGLDTIEGDIMQVSYRGRCPQ